MAAVKPERVAIVCVHGVAAHPRYEFQDQVSGILRDRLNERDGADLWTLDVVNPENVLEPGSVEPHPTITRVRRANDDATAPKKTFYDVTEAYWSPLDKGATGGFGVMAWIFRIVFVPFNTVARIQSSLSKQLFDYTYIGGALATVFALFGLSLFAVWTSLLNILAITGLFRQTTVSETLAELSKTANAPTGQPVAVVVWLLVGILGAFMLGQALDAIFKTWAQRKALWQNKISIWHRVLPILVLAIGGTAFVYAMAVAHFAHGSLGWQGVLLLVGIFVSFQLGRALLVSSFVQFFGDVQIYTTRDENESKFFGLRDEILDTAVTALIRAVVPKANGGELYDRVIVLGHSLGATIATDAITRLKQVYEQGALTTEQFGRIRAFIMLGSSLEKTQYFFSVAGSTPSISYDAWSGGAYADIFDDKPALIAGSNDDKIFWANYWYFQDPICNEMQSYSDVCRNEQGKRSITPWHPMLHSDYLYDPWFWFSNGDHLGALDVITGTGKEAKET